MSPADNAMSPENSVMSSPSDTSLNATLGVPMPTPGMPGAPKFKGKCVADFLDSLEQAKRARVEGGNVHVNKQPPASYNSPSNSQSED